MKYESFNITAKNLRFRGKYGYKNTLPENITELIACVFKNLTGSAGVLCCSSEKVLCDLKSVCDIDYFVIEDISPVSKSAYKTPSHHIMEEKAWVCECGKENKNNFCTHCGKKRPHLVRYCTACGAKPMPDANFCGNCGKKI